MRFVRSVLALGLLAVWPLPAQETPAPLARAKDEIVAGNPDEAERLLDHLLREQPEQREALLLRAELRGALGRTREAIEDADRAVKLDPADPKALTIRGAARFQLKDYVAARADLDEAIRLAPAEPMARRWRGAVRHLQRDYKGAEADESEAIKLKPDFVDAYLARSETRSELANLTGALADADRIVELAPLDPRGRVMRSLLLLRLSRFQPALEDAAQAFRLAPTWPEALQMRATAFLATGDWRSGVADLRLLVEKEISEVDYMRLFIWTAQIRGGEAAAAEREIREYATQRPITAGDDWSARLVLFACGELAEADILKASTELRGRASPAGQQAEACFYAAIRRLVQNDRPGAIKLLRRAAATKADQYTECQLAIAFLPALEKASAPAKPAKEKTPKVDPKKRPKGGSDREDRPV